LRKDTEPLLENSEVISANEPEKEDTTLQEFDGWTLSRRVNIPGGPVRNYIHLLDQNYGKYKVTVCAHLQNIYNSYCVSSRVKLTPNFFDMEKWFEKHSKT